MTFLQTTKSVQDPSGVVALMEHEGEKYAVYISLDALAYTGDVGFKSNQANLYQIAVKKINMGDVEDGHRDCRVVRIDSQDV